MDFSRWLNQQKPANEKVSHAEELEDAGVVNAEADGSFTAKCCCCGEWTELPCGIDEIDLDYEHYCGSGPYCCP